MKTLDQKLSRIRSGAYTPQDFIIADAKDGDLAYGLMAPGPARDHTGRITGPGPAAREVYLQAMRDMVRSGRIDILLGSVSTIELLVREGLFAQSPVTPAVRFNDTTDIWFQRGAAYAKAPSRPFRSARLEGLRPLVDLGLYSVTFSNDVDHDLRTLEAYRGFRSEAADLGLRHFLEVFNPAVEVGIPTGEIGLFIADSIVRSLAGILGAEQPVFLKIMYNGRRAMEQLAGYDPLRLVVGILGGAKGTTRDTFELLARAEAAGARVALFGRKINLAENPLVLVELMRRVLARELAPADAVKAYHDVLHHQEVAPLRPLSEDLQITDPVLQAEA